MIRGKPEADEQIEEEAYPHEEELVIIMTLFRNSH